MAINPVNIQSTLQAYGNLGQTNQENAQRQYQQNLIDKQRHDRLMQTVGALGGAAAGFALAGPAGVAPASGAMMGLGVGQQLGGVAAGNPPDPMALASLGIQAYGLNQQQQQQQQNRLAGQSITDLMGSRLPPAYPDASGNFYGAPGADMQQSALSHLRQASALGTMSPAEVAAVANVIMPPPSIIQTKPGETTSLFNPSAARNGALGGGPPQGVLMPIAQGAQWRQMTPDEMTPSMQAQKNGTWWISPQGEPKFMGENQGQTGRNLNQSANIFYQQNAVKAIQDSAPHIGVMLDALQPGPHNNADDQALLYSYQKIRNPSSEVSLEELKSAQNTTSLFGKFDALWQQVKGGGTLNDEQRAQLAQSGSNYYRDRYALYDGIRKDWIQKISREGGTAQDLPDVARINPLDLQDSVNQYKKRIQSGNKSTAGAPQTFSYGGSQYNLTPLPAVGGQ